MYQDIATANLTLGDVIDSLAALDHDLPMATPLGFGSWRGVYAELTMHHDFAQAETQTVGELLELARAADGGTFYGYKGGDFTMSRHTRVWADGYGDCDGYLPVGFVIHDGKVVMQRIQVDPYR